MNLPAHMLLFFTLCHFIFTNNIPDTQMKWLVHGLIVHWNLGGSEGPSLHQLGLSFHKNRDFLVKVGDPGRGCEIIPSDRSHQPACGSIIPAVLSKFSCSDSGEVLSYVVHVGLVPWISLIILPNTSVISKKQKLFLAYVL